MSNDMDEDFPAKPIGISKPLKPVVNQVRVLHLLRTRGALSRADIARHTLLTKATASRIIAHLLSRNWVREVGVGTLKRGRRPILYQFNTASAIALGVEVREESCQAVVTELDATPLRSYAYSLPDTQVSTFIDVLEQIVAAVRQDFPQQLVGIGIGIPGIFDYRRQTVVLAEHLEWADVELVKLIRERTALNAYVVNRANAAALGEKWYGAGRGRDDLVFITIGAGIKAGIISAGEIGHMTIVPDGPPCVCGKRGCLEALASVNAILDRVRGLIRAGRSDALAARYGPAGETLMRPALLAAAEAGDPIVLGAMHEAATYIGIGVGNMINICNPERVILGGLATEAPPVFADTIRRVAQAHAFSISRQATDIVVAELGQDAVAIGAAALLLSDFLQPAQNSRSFASSAAYNDLPVTAIHLPAALH
jgi:predicted NBD/HSP70 family sugar kinase